METLIRLATAHAKARLSKNVTEEDAQAAIELVEFAYFKRVLEKEKKKRRRHDSEDSTHGEEPSEKKKKRMKKSKTSGEQDLYEFDSDDDNHVDEVVMRTTRLRTRTTSTLQSQSDQPLAQDSDQTVVSETPATITEERYAFKSYSV